MSTQPLSDVARTAILSDLVRDKHPQRAAQGQNALSAVWAILHEVPPQTGWPSGYADVLALHLWPSRLHLVGYEIKASRGDLKRELENLAKHQTTARFCDHWSLVVWDKNWVDGDKRLLGIPEEWGLLAYSADRKGTAYDGIGSLVTIRKPARLTPERWPRTFTAALVRRALEASVGTALARSIARSAHVDGHSAGKYQGKADADKATLDTLAPWREAMRRDQAAQRGRGAWGLPNPDRIEDVLAYVAKQAPPVPTEQLALGGAA